MRIGVLALLAVAAAVLARRLRGSGGGDPGGEVFTWSPPAPEVPGEPALDLDGPNESGPGHHPTDAERRGP